MRIAIAAGGTGGHLYPALGVVRSLRRRAPGVRITLFSVSRGRMPSVGGARDLRCVILPMRVWSRPSLFSAVSVAVRGVLSLLRSLCELLLFRHQASLGMGGYVSVAPLLASRLLGIPTVIYEQNAVGGSANRFLSRIADRVLLAWPSARPSLRGEGSVVGGCLRPDLLRVEKPVARAELGLLPDRFTVLAMGGSQGARALNDCLFRALPGLGRGRPIQIVHLVGTADEARAREIYSRSDLSHLVAPFLEEMGPAYSAADLAFCRSGAGTLSELAFYGLPAILVPYPHAAHDHQEKNADLFVAAGAARKLPQRELTAARLRAEFLSLREDPALLRSMGEKMGRMAGENGSERVAGALIELAASAGRGRGGG